METKKFCLTEAYRCPRNGTTSWPTCPTNRSRRCIPRPKQPVTKEQMSRDLRRGTDRPGDVDRALHRHPRGGAGDLQDMAARRRSCARRGWKRPSERPRRSFSRTKACRPPGSHKPNTAVPQAYYNYKQGITPPDDRNGRRAVGRGRSPSRPSTSGIDVQVFMVKVSYDQKPYRRLMMNTWGAECVASPSHADRIGPCGAGARSATVREASGWPFPRPWRWLCAVRKTRATAWEAC